LNGLNKQIDGSRREIESGLKGGPPRVKKTVANRAVATINNLRVVLRNWFNYYDGYDPLFTWWVEEPYRATDRALGSYLTFLSEKVVGVRADDTTAAIAEGARGASGGTVGRTGGGPSGEGPAAAGMGGGRRQGAGERPVSARPGDASDIIGDPIGHQGLMV